MSAVFIFHGVGGNENENWFPWMKEEIEKAGHTCVVPSFPHSEEPHLQEWLDHFDSYVSQLDEHSIFVGHSLGAAFALNLLERIPFSIKALFAVGGVSGPLENEYDHLMTEFSHKTFDFDAIKRHCKSFEVFHGDDDPYIPLSEARRLSDALHARLHVIAGGGHLNTSAGFTDFPVLLQSIQAYL